MNKWLIISIIALFAYAMFISCRVTPIIPTPTTLDNQPITPEDKKILPDADRKNTYKPSKPPIGYNIETTILHGVTRTVVVENKVIDKGVGCKLGLYGSGNLSTLDLGLSASLLWFWRLNLDALVGVKQGGAGVSFKTFQNTNIGINYTYNWQTFLPQAGIYVSLGF